MKLNGTVTTEMKGLSKQSYRGITIYYKSSIGQASDRLPVRLHTYHNMLTSKGRAILNYFIYREGQYVIIYPNLFVVYFLYYSKLKCRLTSKYSFQIIIF